MDNYRSAINYELQYTQFPDSPRKEYTSTWEKVIKTIYDSKNFGDQLARSKYYKDDLTAILLNKYNESEKATAIFEFVQQRMNWNGLLGYYTDKGVKEAYTERTGNIADINLMLTAMFKEAGLKAEPVLISTRDHGVPLFPTMEGFNYVIASVDIDGEIILFDATNKYTAPNLLPTRTLNWDGKIIKENRTFNSVSVFPKALSQENLIMNMVINPDGMVNGKARNLSTGHLAYSFRNKYAGVNQDDYLEQIENEVIGLEIIDYSIDGHTTLQKPILEQYGFSLENQVDVVGNTIYFSPLFHKKTSTNPFKLEKRFYPIDFSYPHEKRYIVTIAIPEGYTISSKPENIKLVLPDDLGSFTYKIEENKENLQVLVDFKIKAAVLPAVHYEAVKQLYKIIVEKETEKVVLSKIVSGGDQNSAAGSR